MMSVVLSSSIVRSHYTSLYDSTNGKFILFHGGFCSKLVLISVGIDPHMVL
jgi:hypothetical protein